MRLVVCILAIVRAIVMPFLFLIRGKDYAFRCCLAEDTAWNALLAGSPVEPVSARAYRSHWKFWEPAINKIMGSPTHCQDTYNHVKAGDYLPDGYRHG